MSTVIRTRANNRALAGITVPDREVKQVIEKVEGLTVDNVEQMFPGMHGSEREGDEMELFEGAFAAPAAPFSLSNSTRQELLTGDLNETRVKVLQAGSRGLAKLQREGEEAELTPMEGFGVEAIVMLVFRPALLILNGAFLAPPPEWNVLEGARTKIQERLTGIGRIEVDGHPDYDWVGTGFLVADDVIMTNRHVAEIFCQMGQRRRWRFKAGMSGRIDYKEELGSTEFAEYDFRSVIGVHETFDLALFRVKRTSRSGVAAPTPLTIASRKPVQALEKRQVYAVGYPAWDGRRNDPIEMERIFAGIYNVKRLQPGEIRSHSEAQSLLVHDCTTLGGCSGCGVIDLETQQVLGLHFGGRYLEGNRAIALWQLTDDPLIKRAKLNFA